MKRRAFIAATLVAALPGFAVADAAGDTPSLINAELDAGKTLFLDFRTDWCSTCAAQGRVINALKAENPAYEDSVTFIEVDYDEYGRHELTKALGVPRRSTLVVVKGNEIFGRLVAGTSREDIKDMMDLALHLATEK